MHREAEVEEKKVVRPSDDELVDDLIKRAGGIGWFHILFYVAISTGCNNIRAFLNHMIPFLIQKQIYKCDLIGELTSDEGDESISSICTQENICAGDARILAWEIDYSNDRSLNNWVQ